jgi:hypothetical protein
VWTCGRVGVCMGGWHAHTGASEGGGLGRVLLASHTRVNTCANIHVCMCVPRAVTAVRRYGWLRYMWRGRVYGEPDDVARFAFFCRAALEFLARRWASRQLGTEGAHCATVP